MRSNRQRAIRASLALAGIILIAGIGRSQTPMKTTLADGLVRLDRCVDTSLALLGMRPVDLSMPADMLDRDRHRSPFHDRLFTDPLSAAAWTDSITSILVSRNTLDFPTLHYRLAESVGLTPRLPEVITTTSADDTTLTDLVGFDGSTSLTPQARGLLSRFLRRVVQAQDSIAAHRRGQFGARTKLLTEFLSRLDSIWTSSEEDEKLTLWQVHDNEERGRSVTQAVSSGIDPSVVSEICAQGTSLYRDILSQLDLALAGRASLRDSVRSVVLSTRIGRVAIGGAGRDSYAGTYALIIDVGGDDTYDLTTNDPNDSSATMLNVIVDMGGDDVYRGGDHTLGSGHFGIGILIDNAGDDSYTSRDFSLGTGTYGFGIVHDMAGNDVYRSRSNSQGAGIVGMGWLVDDAGHDLYVCASQSQAFAATHGVGVLCDLSGNDRYIAVSPFADVLRYDDHQVSFAQGAALGSRPTMSGGVALLVDASGNDLYSCDIYGQGTAYWFGLGALMDLGGDDRYDAYQYAQGSGVHFAVGVLTDLHGNDVYRSHGVSQGCGHDIATGLLRDHGGDDSYACESLSLGAGNANAVSILFDESGNDSYSALNGGNTMGYSDMRRGYGMIGLFIDAGGRDIYGEYHRNDTAMVRSTYGLMVDAELVQAPATQKPPTQQLSLTHLKASIDSLFIQASASHLRFQNDVAPARKEIGRRGIEALRYLESKFSTQMPRERITLETTLPDLYSSDRDSTIALLRRALQSRDNATVSTAATIVGKVKCQELIPVLEEMLQDSSWRRRRLAAATIGEVSDSVLPPMLKGACADPHPYVRQRAAFHHARILPDDSSNHRMLLGDTLQIVRMALIEGLIKAGRRPMSQILGLIDGNHDRRSLPSVVRLLIAADTTRRDVAMFSAWWRQQSAPCKEVIQRLRPSLPGPLAAIVAAQGPSKRKGSRR